MNSSKVTIIFNYAGLSPAEIENIYEILTSSGEVKDNQISVNDVIYKSTIIIHFPFFYSELFFQAYEPWNNLKDIIKEMKKRRGNKGIKIELSFLVQKLEAYVTTFFTLDSISERDFVKGLEKLEYTAELILDQIEKNTLQTDKIYFYFDGLKWKIYNM